MTATLCPYDNCRPCDNCGAAGEETEPVHRLYLLPTEVRVEEVEQWCAACRSQYPHTG